MRARARAGVCWLHTLAVPLQRSHELVGRDVLAAVRVEVQERVAHAPGAPRRRSAHVGPMGWATRTDFIAARGQFSMFEQSWWQACRGHASASASANLARKWPADNSSGGGGSRRLGACRKREYTREATDCRARSIPSCACRQRQSDASPVRTLLGCAMNTCTKCVRRARAHLVLVLVLVFRVQLQLLVGALIHGSLRSVQCGGRVQWRAHERRLRLRLRLRGGSGMRLSTRVRS